MTVNDVSNALNMKVISGSSNLNREVSGVYICDLLSWVMSHANQGDLWITVLTNLNIVAVAALADVACIVIPEGIHVEEQTVNKANEEGIVILQSDMTSYNICTEVYERLKVNL